MTTSKPKGRMLAWSLQAGAEDGHEPTKRFGHEVSKPYKLHAEVLRDQSLLEELEQLHHQVRMEVVRPLYRQIHPSRALETLKGVGQDGAAVFASFVGDVERFQSLREFRGWSGLVPASAQSGGSEAKGQHIT